MSLTVTQRPYQTINGEVSKWNAVGNPVVYKMQRKDYSFAQTNNNGGFQQIQINGIDVSASFDVGDSVYTSTLGNATVTASAFSGGNTLVTTNLVYVNTDAGFVNNFTLRPLYRVEVEVYDGDDVMMTDSAFSFSPDSTGLLNINISSILRNRLLPDNDSDFSTDVYTDVNVSTEFYIKYNEFWTNSAESPVNDSANTFWALLGSMQIPSLYGGNLYDYLILSDMKSFDVTIATGSVLTGNSVPVNVSETPPAGYIAVPIMWLVYLDYNSVAYATNTTFRFEINGVAVSGTNTTILPGVADRYTTILPIAYDTTTDLRAQPIKFEVQTGDPTAGNSPIRIVTIYTLRSLA